MAQQERAVHTRDALIESAAEMFDRYGFARASLSAISARAGVSNGALHFHFGCKASLADAVSIEAVHRLARITGSGDRVPGGALQLLIDATHAVVRGLGRDAVLRAGFDPGRHLGSPGPAAGARRIWRAWVEDVLVRADREGAMARDVTAATVAATVVAVTMGFGVLSRQDGYDGYEDREGRDGQVGAVTWFWGLLLPGLAAEAVLNDLVASGTPAGAY
ncbi:TetR family transcriptional regulator [Streptomyces sp. NPDC004838]